MIKVIGRFRIDLHLEIPIRIEKMNYQFSIVIVKKALFKNVK